MHKFLLHNGQIHGAGEVLLSPGQTGLLNGWGVFSTLYVVNGVLFAWERHWERMKRDAAMLRVPFPDDPSPIKSGLLSLVEANHAANAVLRLVVVRNKGGTFEGPGIGRPFDVIAFTADTPNWGSGTTLAVQPLARHASSPFAGTKMLSWAFNLIWLEAAKERGFGEVILLNERNEVSECTSANIFAAFGDDVYTPPLNSGCLPGVTRELLLGEVKAHGLRVSERALLVEDLLRADAVFITSTTRQLLAVTEIEGKGTGSDSQARLRLQEAFSDYVDRYVQSESQRVPSTTSP